MFDWLKRKITMEEWRYTCENGHEWKSHSSPGGGVFATKTRCPECGTEICKSDNYVNGEFIGGAIHRAFGLKGKEKDKIMKKLEREEFDAKLRYNR